MKVDTCIVPQDKWSHFEESYEDNVPLACDIAMHALNEIFKTRDIVFTELMLWRKFCGDVPSFQHLCFRYKDKVLSVILAMYGIEGANAAIMSEHEFDALIAECRKYNLTPCVFPVDIVNKRPILDGWHMLDALTNTPIDIDAITDDQGQDVWSEWEYNNFGLTEVAKCLLNNGIGFSETKWFDMIGYEPQFFFWTDNGATKNYVIVRTVPAGLADEEYVIRKRVLEELTDWNGYFVDIKVCSMWNNLDFRDMQIYRVAPVYQPEITFEPIEEAVKNHKNIKLIDD